MPIWAFIYHSKSKSRTFDRSEVRYCPVCERERTFDLVLRYRVHHIGHLFKWASSKRYARRCGMCRHGQDLEARAVESTLKKWHASRPTSAGGHTSDGPAAFSRLVAKSREARSG